MISGSDIVNAVNVLCYAAQKMGKGVVDIEITLPDSQHRSIYELVKIYNHEPYRDKSVFTILGVRFKGKDEEPERMSISHWGMVV